jgi:hypothetical protein
MRGFTFLVLLLFGVATAPSKESVPFIRDDFAKAIAQAQAKNQPIFVEAWAPW